MYTALIAARPGDVFLLEALGSVYDQTSRPARVEVITDHGHEVLTAWRDAVLDRHPDVFFRVQPGTGMVTALNFGIENLQTPYVAFLDTDDLWKPRKQESQLEILESHPEIHAVTCRAVNSRVDDTGSVQLSSPTPSCLFTCTTFRTDSFAHFGAIDPSAGHYAWLYRWWARARRAGIRTMAIDEVGTERRIHGANSWIVGSHEAHSQLLSEIRRIVALDRNGRL